MEINFKFLEINVFNPEPEKNKDATMIKELIIYNSSAFRKILGYVKKNSLYEGNLEKAAVEMRENYSKRKHGSLENYCCNIETAVERTEEKELITLSLTDIIKNKLN